MQCPECKVGDLIPCEEDLTMLYCTECETLHRPQDVRNCECYDPGCVCRGRCDRQAAITLYRVDTLDETGTAFCIRCADDASEFGLFTSLAPHDPQGE